jgi:hypothetical protein
MSTIAPGHEGDCTPTHGYEETHEAATQVLARRSQRMRCATPQWREALDRHSALPDPAMFKVAIAKLPVKAAALEWKVHTFAPGVEAKRSALRWSRGGFRRMHCGPT